MGSPGVDNKPSDEVLRCLAGIPADLSLKDIATVPMPFTAADLRDMASELLRRRVKDAAPLESIDDFDVETHEIPPALLAHLRAATSAHICPAGRADQEAA